MAWHSVLGLPLYALFVAWLVCDANAQPADFTDMQPIYSVRITQGDYLDESAAYRGLIPSPTDAGAQHLNISFTTGKITLETEAGDYVYYGYVYKDNKYGTIGTFGPTLRFTPPAYPTVALYNELTLSRTPPLNQVEDEWSNTTPTNLHQHGFWAYHGVGDIVAPEPYTGGDNVFFILQPKANPNDTAPYNLYNYTVGPYHFPGNHWYHPHKHQATALQTQTAAGNTIIDGEGTFLTAAQGCDTILEVLLTAQERILMLQALFFKMSPTGESFPDLENVYQDPGYQQIADMSNGGDPVCCNTSRTGYSYNMTEENFPLVSGAYQPIITMQSGVYQRWRLVNANFKYWHDLTILYEDTDELAPCDLQLIGKDGIYIMQLPRSIFHITMAAGNRAEVLIKCTGKVGERYRLAGGQYPSFGPGYDFMENDGDIFDVPKLATIEITDPTGASSVLTQDLAQPSQQRACTPLRPAYVSDLRDEVLQKYNIRTLRQELNAQNEVLKGGCSLNGRNWTFPTDITNPPMVMQMGRVVEVQYKNQQFHPVHLHESPQQIVRLNKQSYIPSGANVSYSSYFEVGDWYDTIRIPNIADPTFQLNDTSVTTRLQPGPFSGYSVIHCHYLEHEDRGCMKVVQWRCPDTNPGVNGSIQYPCPGGFSFPVDGDFDQEKTLYNSIPTLYTPEATRTIAPAPAVVPQQSSAGRRLLQDATPSQAPLGIGPLNITVGPEYNYSQPDCNCTDPDIFTGQQYCARVDPSAGTADTLCHFCLGDTFLDEPCQRAGLMYPPLHQSTYYTCTQVAQLPSTLAFPGVTNSVNGLGLFCTNNNFNPSPPPLALEPTAGAPLCQCVDAGPGWGMTGSVLCYTLLNGAIPETDCVPPPQYTSCSVELPIQSSGNQTDGAGKLCRALASAPAVLLPPALG